MTQRTFAAALAVTLVLAGCGYYAPPIRSDGPDDDASSREADAAMRDDALAPADDAATEDADD